MTYMIFFLLLILLGVIIMEAANKINYEAQKNAIIKGAKADMDQIHRSLRVQRRKFRQLQENK